MASMNAHDMETMLGEIRAEDERYKCMLWAIFTCNSPSRILLAQASDLPDSKPNMMPLGNTYAYVGLTEKHINLVVVNAYRTSQVLDRFSIPLTAVTRTEARNGLIMGKNLIVSVGDAKFQLELTPFAAGGRDEEQKAAVDKLTKEMVKLNMR